jgi:hypothetical protein
MLKDIGSFEFLRDLNRNLLLSSCSLISSKKVRLRLVSSAWWVLIRRCCRISNRWIQADRRCITTCLQERFEQFSRLLGPLFCYFDVLFGCFTSLNRVNEMGLFHRPEWADSLVSIPVQWSHFVDTCLVKGLSLGRDCQLWLLVSSDATSVWFRRLGLVTVWRLL